MFVSHYALCSLDDLLYFWFVLTFNILTQFYTVTLLLVNVFNTLYLNDVSLYMYIKFCHKNVIICVYHEERNSNIVLN